jgi:putative ABC transport system permease protein
METVWQDVKYGARMLLKSPGFALVAILTLALGIGANSAIFSVVNAVLMRPLPYDDAEKLVFLTEWSEQVPNMSFSVENFKDVRDQNSVFEGIVAFRSQNFVMTGAGDPERLNGRQVTAGFFPTLRLRPILGREFSAEEDKVGAEKVALLGEGFWTRRFARDPGILNKSLVLNGEPFTVIGVLPGTLHGTWRNFEVFTSLGRMEDRLGGPNNRGNHPGIYVAARRKSGVTFEQARTNVVDIARRLAEQYPNSNAKQSMTVEPLLQAVVGPLSSTLPVLLGAVAFVLLIACANVANLMLARAATRQREIAVRSALGAGRRRIVWQLLTESVLLSVVGGVLGLAIAYGGVRALVAISPANTPRINEVTLDGTVLAFTMVVSVLTGLIFGLFPALQASKPDMAETLKEGGRTGTAGGARHRVRSGLVVAEVSLALVLLIGAGLMLKSFLRVLDADPGFRSDGVLTMSVALPQVKYPEPVKQREFFRQALENIKAVPGVELASSTLPLLGGWQTSFTVEGRPLPLPGQQPSTDISRVSADYFQTMGVRLIKGRTFTEQDTDGQPPVCIVDERMVQAYWPSEEPLGKRMRLGSGQDNNNPWMTVVGVVAHVKNYGVDQDSRVETYLPYLQNPVGSATLVLKSAGDAGSIANAVRAAVRAVDADLPVYNVRPLDAIVSDGRAQRRLAAQLLATFSGLALLLAAIGIYGVMSYSVTQRAHEIGIRLALGAQKDDILRLVVGHGMLLAGIGLTVGLGMAFALAFGLRQALTTMLFRVSHTDPPTYASVPLLLAAVALLACYIPARRALKVDPMIALRYE